MTESGYGRVKMLPRRKNESFRGLAQSRLLLVNKSSSQKGWFSSEIASHRQRDGLKRSFPDLLMFSLAS